MMRAVGGTAKWSMTRSTPLVSRTRGDGRVLMGGVGDEPSQDRRPVLLDLDDDPRGVQPLVLAEASLNLLTQPQIPHRG